MTRDPSPSRRKAEECDLAEAARTLGVHYMTAYRYVRLGRLPATRRDGRWWVSVAELGRLRRERTRKADPHRARRGTGQRGRPRPRTYQRRLEERLVAGDEPGAWSVVESALVSGITPRSAVIDVIAPALRSIGDGWETGRLSVTDEHRASAVAQRVVSRLGPQFARRGRTRGTVILAGAPNDPHSLPTALVANVLRGERYTVVDLGANTPVASIVEAVAASSRLLAVGLSVSAEGHEPAVRRTIRALRKARPQIPVFLGGPAIGSLAAARALGADQWAGDAGGFAERLETLRHAG